jgi:cellulose synthase/poly-beta-1,6-N-acetylglucosamine synthase-like glycosyltransferase
LVLLDIVFIAVAFCYVLFFWWLRWGLNSLKPHSAIDLQKNGQPQPSVSVIIPMHNEEEFIERTLLALHSQNYLGQKEFICVNDRSVDQTGPLVRAFCEQNPEFKYFEIPQDAPKVSSPKKRALELGFKNAQGQIWMTMDADCMPPVGWMNSMILRFEPHIDIVQGPKKIIGTNSLIHSFQKLDTLGFTTIEAAFFAWQKPMLASAPSLGYRREVFEQVHGFEGLEDLESGDDDMLVQKMSQVAHGVTYNADADAQVGTAPVDSWRALFSQRARWASNGATYDNKMYVILLLCIYTFFILLFFGPVLICFDLMSLWLYVAIVAIKMTTDFVFILKGAQILRSQNLLKWFLFVFFVQIPLIVWAGIAGRMKWYKW